MLSTRETLSSTDSKFQRSTPCNADQCFNWSKATSQTACSLSSPKPRLPVAIGCDFLDVEFDFPRCRPNRDAVSLTLRKRIFSVFIQQEQSVLASSQKAIWCFAWCDICTIYRDSDEPFRVHYKSHYC